MQYLTLEDIQKKVRKAKIKNFIKTALYEIMTFCLVMIVVSVFGIVFINFGTFIALFKAKFMPHESLAGDINMRLQQELNLTSYTGNTQSDDLQMLRKIQYSKVIDNKLDALEVKEEKKIYQNELKKYLKEKAEKYSLNFNLLPPDNRIIIPSKSIHAPIVKVLYTTPEKMEASDYDAELYKGVVQYPYTSDPDQDGNMLVFGHTSYYWWKENPYGDIFAQIPRLDKGSTIQIIWEGQLYEYEILHKLIRSPKYVANTYKEYQDGRYLTLMGCYPVGSDAKRILVVAKQKNPPKLSLNQ